MYTMNIIEYKTENSDQLMSVDQLTPHPPPNFSPNYAILPQNIIY